MATNELIYRTRVVFKVHNFTDIKGNGANGDHFVIGSDQWQVCILFDGDGDQKFVGPYLNLIKCLEETIVAIYIVSILDSDYRPVKTMTGGRKAYGKTLTEGWGFKDFIQYKALVDQIDKYLPNNTLTVTFDITVFKPSIVGHQKRLSFGFGDKDFSDCRLVVQKEEFFASKLLLSHRSEVFRKMFSDDMSEKTTNIVTIEDIDPKVFREFLRFLYFGDSDKLQEMAEQLIYISDKYMVDDLKTICENLLYLQINTTNAFQVLEVLDKYGNTDLKTKAIQYIGDNWHKCLEKDTDRKSNEPFIGQIINYLLSCISMSPKPTQTMSFSYLV